MSVTRASQKAYTLVELLVSVSIFAIVMLGATTAYLSFISYNRQAQTTATVINTLFFAVDGAARDIRAGSGYTCSGGCSSSGNNAITFTDASACTVTYSKVSNAIVRTVSGSGCTALTNVAITDPSVTVSTLLFYVRGTATYASGDRVQPMATIVIKGSATVPNSTTQIPFQIETGATQRLPDL